MYKNVGTLLKHIYKLHKSLLALINHLVTQVTDYNSIVYEIRKNVNMYL